MFQSRITLIIIALLWMPPWTVMAQPAAPGPNSVAPAPMPRSNSATLAELADENQSAEQAEEAGEGENGDSDDGLLDLSIEQLRRTSVAPALDIEVTTVARTASTVGRSPAAVYVVTNEMIRRSGARNIPDVLRMVPGLNVARIDNNNWAITCRGFNSQFANKLLVQVDGRTVYSPLISGVYWSLQSVLPEDVERIEVIRGPGATVWGANAVNGVISIITKSAKDTQGIYAHAGGGSEEKLFTAVRGGGSVNDNLHYRIYGKQFNINPSTLPTSGKFDVFRPSRGDRGFDFRKGVQTGFRIDCDASCQDTVTIQGDYLSIDSGLVDVVPTTQGPEFLRFADEGPREKSSYILGRWTRKIDDESDFSVQFYYDHFDQLRNREVLVENYHDALDLDCQYRFPLGNDHSVVTGFRYRTVSTVFNSEELFLPFFPNSYNFDRISYFVQDTITLSEDFSYLILGCKFEHNDFTGFEYQPTIRLLCTPNERQSIWAAISRAVRTPPVYERNIRLTSNPIGPEPTFPRIFGSPDTVSEELIAYEVGMRAQPTDRFSWDLAAFYNDYGKLQSITYRDSTDSGPPPGTPPLFENFAITNNGIGETYGFELAADYEMSESWRLHGSYSYLIVNIWFHPGSDPFGLTVGPTPTSQVYAQSSWDIGCRTKLDLMFRYVDSISGFDVNNVPSYFVMDTRLAWEPRPGLEFSVVGRNLLDGDHVEYQGDTSTKVQQEVYGMVSWRY